MSGPARGMPLLSGIPPPNSDSRAETACRKCNKEFNILFARAKKCNHCGYAYCSSCADHQALAPRQDPTQSGYEVLAVCAFCIDHLTITASGRSQLRAMPIPKLRGYLKAYNITPQSVLEKADLIEGILNARMPNGCLPPDKEEYYRAHSVPNKISTSPRARSAFQRAADGLQRAAEGLVPPSVPPRPRSASATGHRPQPPTHTRPQPQSRAPPHPARPHPHQPSFHHPRPMHSQPPQTPPRPHNAQPSLSPPRAPPRPASVPPRPPQQPPAPVPSLRALLSSPNPEEYIPSLSIHTLKAILEENHVNSRLLLEKSELVDRVKMLVENERIEREQEEMWRADEEAAEDERRRERERDKEEEEARRAAAAAATSASREIPPMPTTTAGEPFAPAEVPLPVTPLPSAVDLLSDPRTSTSSIPPPIPPPKPESSDSAPALPPKSKPSPPAPVPPPKAKAERTGLCVVCQDEEANIVTVDCGHLALCMDCSKLIMQSSRECPLCRTRIVTEQRLLRVFKS